MSLASLAKILRYYPLVGRLQVLLLPPLLRRCFALLVLLLCLATSVHAQLNATVMLQNLKSPWALAFISETEVLISLKGGELIMANLANQQTDSLPGVPDSSVRGQGGLMDVELHPDFKNNQWLYLTFTLKTKDGYTTALAKSRLVKSAKRLADTRIIFTARAFGSGGRHFGSRLAFDNLGFLYMSVGDRGEREHVQDLMRHNGKIVRLHDDGRIPADNPFTGDADVLPDIYSYGHRNPQGMVYDHANQRLWINEHGPKGGDELNLVVPGKNYGWPRVSHGREYSGQIISETAELDGTESPVFHWTPSIAPSGMAIYRGTVFSDWQDNILVGALKYQLLTRVVMQGTTALTEHRYLEGKARIRDVKVGPDDAVYVLTDGANGQLWKVTPG